MISKLKMMTLEEYDALLKRFEEVKKNQTMKKSIS